MLDKTALTNGIPGAGDAYPETRQLCAKAWADAAGAWAAGIVPPSTTVPAATAALEVAVLGAFNSPLAAPLLDAAFMQFALVVGSGMLPVFAATPPAGPPGFAALFAQPMPTTRVAGVERVAAMLHAWMQTGSAALVLPPNTAQPWA
jgi:hypothetical protein